MSAPVAEAIAPDPAPAPPAAAPAPRRSAAPTQTAPPVRETATSTAADRAAPAAAAPRPPAAPTFREVTAPVGAELALELTAALSTETAQVESPVTARLRQALVIDGVTVLPAGATLHGTVTDVERPGRVRGRALIAFRFTEVRINDEEDVIRTNPLSFEGEASTREDVTKVGAGAGIGAVIGGILGGGGGAAKGAAIGGAAGAGAVVATRGEDIVMAAGTALTATLASPYVVRVEVR